MMSQKNSILLISLLSIMLLGCGSENADKAKKDGEKNAQKPRRLQR
jgi:hypothetical protein